MNNTKTKNQVKFIVIAAILCFVLCLYWVYYLRWAHSTFDHYYKFRGCATLISKTDEAGYCKLKNGSSIKIVKFNGKWYLDGDLPSGKFLDF